MKNKRQPLTWLVIANSVKADLYEIVNKEYSLIQSFDHPQSRLKSADINSDKPGHYMTNHSAHGQFVIENSPHKVEHDHFAKELADFLDKNKQQNHYQSLIFCAEPRFYGLVNQHLSDPVRTNIVKVVEKDYIPLPKAKIHEIIENIIVDM